MPGVALKSCTQPPNELTSFWGIQKLANLEGSTTFPERLRLSARVFFPTKGPPSRRSLELGTSKQTKSVRKVQRSWLWYVYKS